HAIARGRANPDYAPREDPTALAPAYWGADLRVAGAEWMRTWKPGAADFGSDDKLQLFSAAHPVPEDPRQCRLDPNDRLPMAVAVLGFHPNDLRLRIDAPIAGAWLLYADVWAAAWQASVNGTPREIAKANGVYK